MRKTSCLTAMYIMAGLTVPGSAGAETMQEALVSAYNSNPTLLAQRARLRVADEGVPQALANWRPSIKLSGDYGKNQTTTNQSRVSQAGTFTSTPKDAGLTVTQALYRGGRTTAQTRQAEATVEAERAGLAATEQTVLLNVITAYMDVVQFRAVVELSRNNEQVLQRQLDATNDRFRVGEVTRTDVAQAESRLSAAHADRRQAEGNLAAATATYSKTVGHPPDTLFVPGPTEKLPASVDAARTAAEHDNPNIINAQYNYVAATHGIDLVAGELLPSVTLTGNAAKNFDYQGEGPVERVLQATVNLTVPIYQQGQEYARLRAQKHSAGQARLTVDVTRRDAMESVTKAWEGLQTARARISSYSDQIRAAEVALEGVTRESQVGSRTVLDVLNAEQELLTAKVNLVQAQHDETLASYQLRSTVGQLTARALDLPVQYYDPVIHYEDVRDQWFGAAISPAYSDEVK
ncbi:MAG TPA: TolC family outer membrane protein [Rhodospirillaceae bacterium]|nr:TolC family outer membrane protein [Rhodospirillaceae bacterium]